MWGKEFAQSCKSRWVCSLPCAIRSILWMSINLSSHLFLPSAIHSILKRWHQQAYSPTFMHRFIQGPWRNIVIKVISNFNEPKRVYIQTGFSKIVELRFLFKTIIVGFRWHVYHVFYCHLHRENAENRNI